MSRNLLITELNHKGKTSLTESRFKKLKRNKKEKENKKSKEKTQTASYFLIKNQKKYNRAKLDLMNYLVDEQARYTNLDNAVEYYQNQLEIYKRQMNKNDNIIKQKTKTLESMNSFLGELLLKNYVPTDNGELEKEEALKTQLEIQIQTFTQALDMYQNIKNELLIEKIHLKKDLKNEYFESLTRKKHYDNYLVVKTKIENEEKSQDHLYKTMNNFKIKTKSMFDEEENKKKNILAKEEFALNQLKQDMKETEEHLIKIQKKIGRREKILPFEKRRNFKVIQDNKILRKELFANFFKLYLIKQNFKLKNLEHVVDHVKKQNLIFNSKINNLNRMLNNITNLNREMSENGKEMREIKEMIKEKLDKVGIICDIPEIIKLVVELNRCKESNIISNENANNKENLIKEIMRFIFRYNNQFEKIIKSILVYNMKIKEKSISKNELDNILELFNNKENIDDIEKYSSTEHFSIIDYKSVLKIIMQFFRKANYIYNNFIIDIAIEASNENEKEKEKEKEKERKIKEKLKDKENEKNEEIENENEKEDKKVEIIIFSNIPKEQEEEEIEKKMLEKQNLFAGKKLSNSQKKQELLKQNISKEINNMLDQGIDIEVLLERYLTALRRKNDAKNKVVKKDKFQYETLKEKRRNDRKRREYEKVNKRIRERRLLFDKLKMKLFLDLSKYTSDLVKHDDWDKKNKTKYNIDIRLVNRKKNTKNVLSELLQEYNRNKVEKKFNKSLNQVFKNIVRKGRAERAIYFPKQKNEFEEIQVLDDTFIDENEYNKHPDIEIVKKIKKKEKNYFGYKSNLSKIENSFKTSSDLHKINLELFHKKTANEENQDLDLIQNEFQKKLNMKIYSPIVNHFTPSRRLNKKNRLKAFLTSNTSLNHFTINNNYIDTNSNKELISKTLRVNKRKLDDSKNNSKFPKITSGNITITD